jgi:hypothetical protein
MSHRVRRIALFLLATLFATGCGDLKRLRECDRIASTANPILETVERMSTMEDGGAPSPGVYKQIAKQYQMLDRQLLELRVADDRVKAALAIYRDMLGDIRGELGRLAESQKGDAPLSQKKRSPNQALAPVLHKEQVALQRLKSACRP